MNFLVLTDVILDKTFGIVHTYTVHNDDEQSFFKVKIYSPRERQLYHMFFKEAIVSHKFSFSFHYCGLTLMGPTLSNTCYK